MGLGMDWADRIGVRLKLRDLHILLAVVEWKSMAKAAKHLAISQPVVSRAIADLAEIGGRPSPRPHAAGCGADRLWSDGPQSCPCRFQYAVAVEPQKTSDFY